MAKKPTMLSGTCELCGEQFAKAAVSRHLAKCLAQRETDATSGGKGKLREILLFKVEGRYLPQYWLYLETAADSQFAVVDSFLRYIWLECCGHCSAFRLTEPKPAGASRGNKMFAALVAQFDDIDEMMRREEAIMGTKIGSRVKVGDTFDYEYDFGSTTELRLKLVSKRDGRMKPGDVTLLARNLPPDIRCQCGQPAKWICGECSWEPSGWLCRKCGKSHGCGDEMFLPVVNSPRVGVCGYCGPEE